MNSNTVQQISHKQNSNPVRVVVVGHVDDGKSTLIGRLLYETKSLPEGKMEELNTLSAKRGMQLEWSFVLDAFQAERNQAITIDTSYVLLKTETRDIVIIDAPGHIEFLKNMVSGTADADAALLLVDATKGVREQTRRHAYFIRFLGIEQVIVLINKMDLVDYDRQTFEKILLEIEHYLKEIGLTLRICIPISARQGEMLSQYSEKMPWYSGETVLGAILQLDNINRRALQLLRFPVQDVYKFDERRIIAGRMESGKLQVGDTVFFSPTDQTGTVQSIESWNQAIQYSAEAGQSIGITLDKNLFVERGHIISHVNDPPFLTTVFRATLFWLGKQPLQEGKRYKIKLATQEASVTVQSIEYDIDIEKVQKRKATFIEKNGCGEVILRLDRLIPLDEYRRNRSTGRFVLVEDYEIVAGGMISMDGYPDQRKKMTDHLNLTQISHHVTSEERMQRSGHKSGVLWLTGLSGSGKSTLAMQIEHHLFNQGYLVYTLDGDNIRTGLNSNLSFTPQDRMENIRRIAEVAALFSDAGFICITSFISPYQADRENARKILSQHGFYEVYIKADLEICEKRDPKGLYKKARLGEISNFTGISAPYETPLDPDLIIDTTQYDVYQCVNRILKYVKTHFSDCSQQRNTKMEQERVL